MENMKKRLMFAIMLISLVAGLFVACSGDIPGAENDGTPAMVSFGSGRLTRDLSPSYSMPGFETLYWYYTAEKLDSYGVVGVETEETPVNDGVLGLDGTVGPFSQGKWSFTLYAYNTNEVDKTLVYEGTNPNVILKGGDNKVAVTVSPQAENGSIALQDAYFMWAEGAPEGKPTVRFSLTNNSTGKVDNFELDVADRNGDGKFVLNFGSTTGNVSLLSVNVGTYKCDVFAFLGEEYSEESVIAANSFTLNVLGGGTTIITGDLIENPNASVDFDAESSVNDQMDAKIFESLSADNSVKVDIAPNQDKNTEGTVVNFGNNSVNNGTHQLVVEVSAEKKASSKFENVASAESAEYTAVASIDLSLYKTTADESSVPTTEAVTSFDEEVTITTYVQAGLGNVENLRLVYVDSEGSIVESGADGCEHEIVSYNNETGELVFTTNHFSSFYVTLKSDASANGFDSGIGTEINPYVIRTVAQLQNLATQVNEGNEFKGKYFILASDLNLSGINWEPIGYGRTDDADPYPDDGTAFNGFAGHFDGDGHTISNLQIHRAPATTTWEESYVGLFGCVESGASIKNLSIENIDISANSLIGSVVGYVPNDEVANPGVTIFDNITVTGSIKINGQTNIGGILGRNEPRTKLIMTNCHVEADEGSNITAIAGAWESNFVGGIVGAAYSGNSNTFNNVSVENLVISGDVEAVGGIAGLINVGEVSNISLKNITAKLGLYAASYPNDAKAMGAIAGHVGAGDGDVSKHLLTISGGNSFENVVLDFSLPFTPFCNGLIGTYRSDDIQTTDPSENSVKGAEKYDGVSSIFAIDSSDDFANAISNGGSYYLTDDVIVTSDNVEVAKDFFIDLDGKKLDIESSNTVVVEPGVVSEFRNGSLTINLPETIDDITISCLQVSGGSSLTFSDVDYHSNRTGVWVYGNDTLFEAINDSTINVDGYYCVGTNAANSDQNVTIRIDSSELKSGSIDEDSNAILFNIPGTLSIMDSYIEGGAQAVIIRGGDATIKNSQLVSRNLSKNDRPESAFAQFLNGNWVTGNGVPCATLVVGNRSTSYVYPTSCSVENTSITMNNKDAGTYVTEVYISSYNNRKVELNIEEQYARVITEKAMWYGDTTYLNGTKIENAN